MNTPTMMMMMAVQLGGGGWSELIGNGVNIHNNSIWISLIFLGIMNGGIMNTPTMMMMMAVQLGGGGWSELIGNGVNGLIRAGGRDGCAPSHSNHQTLSPLYICVFAFDS